mgnify:CR=1 FL=1
MTGRANGEVNKGGTPAVFYLRKNTKNGKKREEGRSRERPKPKINRKVLQSKLPI